MKIDYVPEVVKGESVLQRAEKLMTCYADAQSRKSVEDAVMKAAKEELISIYEGNPKLRNEKGHLLLGDGYLRTSSSTTKTETLVLPKKLDLDRLKEIDDELVKRTVNAERVKAILSDADNPKRKALRAMKVDFDLRSNTTHKTAIEVTRQLSAAQPV